MDFRSSSDHFASSAIVFPSYSSSPVRYFVNPSSRRVVTEKFYSWGDAVRQEFLDFCTGVRGVKLLYDSFFKEIMNPETVPERLEDLALIPGWRWIFCRIAKMNTI